MAASASGKDKQTWGSMTRETPKTTWGNMTRETPVKPSPYDKRYQIPVDHRAGMVKGKADPKADSKGIYGGNKKRRRSKSKKIKAVYRKSRSQKRKSVKKQRKSKKNRR